MTEAALHLRTSHQRTDAVFALPVSMPLVLDLDGTLTRRPAL